MKRLLLAALALSLASACKDAPAPHPEGAAVLIKQSHFHTRYCGHYRYRDQWFFMYQHRHGVDCGHELVDGEWILPEN